MAINTAGQNRTGNSIPADAPKVKVGRLVLDATALTAADQLLFEVGFTPKYVVFENVTDRIKVEWYEGMAADTCIKTAAAGTRTLETTNKGITICDADGVPNVNGRYFAVSQNVTLAVVTASDTHTFMAVA
jgi:hypothetical protein